MPDLLICESEVLGRLAKDNFTEAEQALLAQKQEFWFHDLPFQHVRDNLIHTRRDITGCLLRAIVFQTFPSYYSYRGRFYLPWTRETCSLRNEPYVTRVCQAIILQCFGGIKIPGLNALSIASIQSSSCRPPSELSLPFPCSAQFWMAFDTAPYFHEPTLVPFIQHYEGPENTLNWIKARESYPFTDCATYPLAQEPTQVLCPFSIRIQSRETPDKVFQGGVLYNLHQFQSCFLDIMLDVMRNEPDQLHLMVVKPEVRQKVEWLCEIAQIPKEQILWQTQHLKAKPDRGIWFVNFELLQKRPFKHWIKARSVHRMLLHNMLCKIPSSWPIRNVWFSVHEFDARAFYKVCVSNFIPKSWSMHLPLVDILRILTLHYVVGGPAIPSFRNEIYQVKEAFEWKHEELHTGCLRYIHNVLKFKPFLLQLNRLQSGIRVDRNDFNTSLMCLTDQVRHTGEAYVPIPCWEVMPEERSDEAHECTICFQKSSQLIRAACGHVFCYTCLSEWNFHKSSCPNCRAMFETDQFVRLVGSKRIHLEESLLSEALLSKIDVFFQFPDLGTRLLFLSHYDDVCVEMGSHLRVAQPRVFVSGDPGTEIPVCPLIISHTKHIPYLQYDHGLDVVVFVDFDGDMDARIKAMKAFYHVPNRFQLMSNLSWQQFLTSLIPQVVYPYQFSYTTSTLLLYCKFLQKNKRA